MDTEPTQETSDSPPNAKALLLGLPDHFLDHKMRPYIEKWDEPVASSTQVLEVLDYCVNGSLANGIVMALLQSLLAGAIKTENTTYTEVVAKATWRAEL